MYLFIRGKRHEVKNVKEKNMDQVTKYQIAKYGEPTAYFYYGTYNDPIWFCRDHAGKVANAFWANGDFTFEVVCRECNGTVDHAGNVAGGLL